MRFRPPHSRPSWSEAGVRAGNGCEAAVSQSALRAMMSKPELRKEARQRRKALEHPGIAAALAAHASALKLAPGAVVGGYHALAGEADPALLLKELVARGCHIAFPRIAARDM